MHSHLLIRIAIALACGLLGLAATVLVGVVIDAPMWAMAHGIREHFGGPGLVAFILLSVVALFAFGRWVDRKVDRDQIAASGILEHQRPTFVREGLGRNLAILLTPLVVLVIVLLALWFSGIPLPGPGR